MNSNFFEQITKIWNQFSYNQKISIFVSTLVLFVVMGGLMMWSSRPSMKLLYGNLAPEDMADVLAKLDEKSIPYEIKNGGNAVFVPGDFVYTTRLDLSAQGIPSGGSIGFEIFDKGNFGISDFHQRTNYNRAIQGELSRTIAQMKNVRSARVMIVVPETRLLINNEGTNKPTASVFIDTGGKLMTDPSVNAIRFLVANAVEGLQVDQVAVVDEEGAVLSERLVGSDTLEVAGGQMRFKQSMEKYYTRKIEELLLPVVGQNNVVAKVSLAVDTDTMTMVEERYDPNSKVVMNEQKTNDVVESVESGAGGVVGADGNDAQAGAAAGGGSNSTSEKRTDSTATFAYNKTVTERIKRPGEISRLSAAVFVAMRYTTQGEGENATVTPKRRTADEMNDLYAIVSNALGIEIIEGGGRPQNVTIREVEFTVNETPQMSGFVDMPETLTGWTDMINDYLVVAIALFIFFLFLKLLKQNRPTNFSVEILNDQEQRKLSTAARNVTPKPTPELLNDLIKQKPENVSSALQSWTKKET